ncbi:hypothetical protein [Bosea sp. MMO-172]|uniref:hypothetical protein n=1 Tax=Bosea sp. MMO-172 TaxID=3127885 RepID=UPI0030180435
MSILLVPIAIGAIVFLCWLLFFLASFVLPFYLGLSVGLWALESGAGWIGAPLIGIATAGLTLALGHILLIALPWFSARLAVAALFVAPSVLAGYHATHGIAKHVMPSETWQVVFSLAGAVAVGCVAWLRVVGAAAAFSGKH